jgi:hypothetical protein
VLDARQHVIDSSHHIQVGVTQYDNALRGQPLPARLVVFNRSRLAMLASIQFDGEFERRCAKIHDVISDGVLAQKTHTAQLSRP